MCIRDSLKLVRASAALAAQHYSPLVADRGFRSLVSRLAGARVSALVFEGVGVVIAAKELVGDAAQPAPASLRGAAGLSASDAAVASASPSAAAAPAAAAYVGFFQAEDGIRDVERSRGLGDVYKRQVLEQHPASLRLSLIHI